jgi:hypothetical protein
MIGIRSPFYRKTNQTIYVTCAHCAKNFLIGIEHVRVTNYCGDCK